MMKIFQTVGASTTFNIDGLTFPDNEYVVDDKLAPSSTGFFDIVIDPTGTSVAVRFDVTLDEDSLNIIDAIHFSNAYKIVNDEEVSTGIVQTGEDTFSGVISLSDVTNGIPTTLRFYIEWEEEETTEGNIIDSQLGSYKDLSTTLPITVVVTQYSRRNFAANLNWRIYEKISKSSL